jgi:hypothetical protein
VAGTAVYDAFAWTRFTYPVTFTETGLPSGTQWGVNVSGLLAFASGSDALTCRMPNGTFLYSGSAVGTAYSSPRGSIAVHGTGASEALAFTAVPYSVTFTESGLPSGTDWAVTLNGVRETASGSPSPPPGSCPAAVCRTTWATVTFLQVVSGSYPFVVDSVPGYDPNPQDGSVTVNGSATTRAIEFTAAPSMVLGLAPLEGLAVVGGVIAIMAAAVVLIALPGRRRTVDSQPPTAPAERPTEPRADEPPGIFWPPSR